MDARCVDDDKKSVATEKLYAIGCVFFSSTYLLRTKRQDPNAPLTFFVITGKKNSVIREKQPN